MRSKGLLAAVTAVIVVAVGTGVAQAALQPEPPSPTPSVGGDPGVRGAATGSTTRGADRLRIGCGRAAPR